MNETQAKMVREAIGDGTDFPKLTNDPEVNCAVDVIVCNGDPWGKLSKIEKKFYIEEVKLI